MTACECTFSGDGRTSWCPRHKCAKTAHWHRLCQTQPAYFELWEQGRGQGQGLRRVKPAEHMPCLHQGHELRRQECATCPGFVRVKIFACSLHVECAHAKEFPGVTRCATCVDYSSPNVAAEFHEAFQHEPPSIPS